MGEDDEALEQIKKLDSAGGDFAGEEGLAFVEEKAEEEDGEEDEVS